MIPLVSTMASHQPIGVYNPRPCRTFHSLVPKDLRYTKKFPLFCFQNYYFCYSKEINNYLSRKKKNQDDINIEIRLKSFHSVYQMDSTKAERYRKDLFKSRKVKIFLTDYERTIYFSLLFKTFQPMRHRNLKTYVNENPNLVYLLYRPIDYPNEVTIRD